MEDKYRVYVSKEEWGKLSELAQLELIALSMMTGEDIINALEQGDRYLVGRYIKLMDDD